MSTVLLIARVLLGGVFVFAGLAKLRDPNGTRRAAVDFGVPELLARPIARVLPFAEIVLALGLLPLTSAALAATTIAALLVVFTIAIAISILSGNQTVCHCFGETGSTPVGWSSVARNVALAAMAVFIAWPKATDAGPSLLAWWRDASPDARPVLALALTALIACIGLGWVCLGLLRQHGRLLLRIEALEQARPATAHVHGEAHTVPVPGSVGTPPGLPVGTPVPAFLLKDLAGLRVGNADLRTLRRPVLLLFSDPNCGPCNSMRPDLERWAAQYADRFALVVATRGAKDANRKHYAGTAASYVLLDTDMKLAEQLSTMPTPSALVVDAQGVIRSDVAIGQRGIEALVASLTGTVPTPSAETGGGASAVARDIGVAMLAFDLPAVAGGRVSETALKGETTLLMFWNPGCGFCMQMLAGLRHWESTRAKDSPRMMVVSAGTPADNMAMALTSTIGLDANFSLGNALGVPGTPSAVLVDAQGCIASEIAVSEPAIWRLLGVEPAPQPTVASA